MGGWVNGWIGGWVGKQTYRLIQREIFFVICGNMGESRGDEAKKKKQAEHRNTNYYGHLTYM